MEGADYGSLELCRRVTRFKGFNLEMNAGCVLLIRRCAAGLQGMRYAHQRTERAMTRLLKTFGLLGAEGSLRRYCSSRPTE